MSHLSHFYFAFLLELDELGLRPATDADPIDYTDLAINDISGYIGPTLIFTPLTEIKESYLDVKIN